MPQRAKGRIRLAIEDADGRLVGVYSESATVDVAHYDDDGYEDGVGRLDLWASPKVRRRTDAEKTRVTIVMDQFTLFVPQHGETAPTEAIARD